LRSHGGGYPQIPRTIIRGGGEGAEGCGGGIERREKSWFSPLGEAASATWSNETEEAGRAADMREILGRRGRGNGEKDVFTE